MTIRNKLLVIVVALVAAFLASAGVFFAIVASVGKIEGEKVVVSTLRDDMYDMEVKTNRLLAAGNFSDAVKTLNTREETVAADFAAVQGLKTLPKAGKDVAESLYAISQLNNLIESTGSELNSILASTLDLLGKSSGNSASQSLWMIMRNTSASKDKEAVQLYFLVTQSVNRAEMLTLTLDSAIGVIDKQAEAIDARIAAIKARSFMVAGLIVLLIVGTAVILSLRIGRGIVGRISAIETGIASMKDGDLTRSLAVVGSDEVSGLSSDLGDFGENLRSSIAKVQAVSAENIAVKDTLIATAEESLSATQQISANGESIGHRIEALNASLDSATSAVGSIGESISTLDGRIQGQMSMVEESTASVTEMIASISNVAKIADQRRQAVDGLVGAVSAGGEKLAATTSEIDRITESVDNIKDITAIIANVSSQTNLLAMNAAIEAAHAGESGRGFSVVADEIRKLAEASAANSKEIGAILKDIVDRVDSVSRSGAESNQAFRAIEAEVKGLRDSLAEIFSNMSELHAGGDQILQAMNSLRDASASVKDDSSQIGHSASSISDSMSDLKRVSMDVAGGMSEISTGTNEISTAMKDVVQNAERVGSLGESLNAELARFKTA